MADTTDDEADAALELVIQHGATLDDELSGEYYVLQLLINRWESKCLLEHRAEFRERADELLTAFCELELVVVQASKAGEN